MTASDDVVAMVQGGTITGIGMLAAFQRMHAAAATAAVTVQELPALVARLRDTTASIVDAYPAERPDLAAQATEDVASIVMALGGGQPERQVGIESRRSDA